MLNRPSYAIGMSISQGLTVVNLNRHHKLIHNVKCPLTDTMIRQGEIIEIDLCIKAIDFKLRGKSLVLAIDDNWIEQQRFAIPQIHRKALDYLIKQKVSPGNAYDYHLYQGQCTLWQLSKTRYQSYVGLAKQLGLTLTVIEPESCANARLFAQNLPQPYGIHHHGTLYVIDHNNVVFSHPISNGGLEQGIQLFEKLHQQKLTHLISNQDCSLTSSCTPIFLRTNKSYDIDPDFMTAYSAALRRN